DIVRSVIIAIDGPAGAGKSTVARTVAARLGFAFLDTGALYRCAVLAGVRQGELPEEIVESLDIRLGDRILLDGDDVTLAIRAPEISGLTPVAAARPELRAALTRKQRELMAHGNWVAEGRDIGTVVAPDAEIKVFLTASVQARAQRRACEHDEDVETVRAALVERDRMDREREHGPLHAASDAVEIDTTGMSTEQAVEAVLALVPDAYKGTPALFAVTAEGVAPPRKRGMKPLSSTTNG
ncbi:MAG TPA: (d)CMP kinase, partial [Solirubrobacteraceae bacterium]|nr:(d)CMP kinase [Solirubrobacteraceae bacterium]